MIRSGEPVIDTDALGAHGAILGAGVCGTVPRDYSAMPARRYGAVDMPVLSMDEIKARATKQATDGTRLSDIYLGMSWENLDQNGDGYCWQYGPTHALMMMRAVQNEPFVRLSAHAVAARFKKGVDEGAWGAQGLENLTNWGAPAESLWQPMHRRNPYAWSAEVEADAKKQRVSEAWFDAAAPVYDRDMSWQQALTLLVSGVPVVVDYDWWGHCVCALDAVVLDDGSMSVRILNSWKGWGQRGLAVLKGSQAVPSNAVAIRAATVS